MANSWLRLWHEMPNDPKWRTIARASGQRLSVVKSAYLHILVSASEAKDRGTYTVSTEDIASALDETEADIQSVIDAMQGRVLEGNHVSGWESRQPAKEDGANDGKSAGSNYVYYVGTTDNDVVKVGISRNPWSRVKDLQTGSYSKFVLLATMKTDSRSEFELHSFFKDSRKNGEWFSPSEALNSLIEKTKNGDLQTMEACIEYLNSLPSQAFVVATDNYRRTVVTTKDKDKEEIKNTNSRGKRESDPRHTPFKEILDQAWKAKNPKIEMPWDAGAAKQLASLLSANPTLTSDAFRSMLRNRHKSEVNHAESPKSFLPRLTDFAGGPLDRFNKPFDKTDVIAFKPVTIAEQLAKQRQGA